MTRLGFKSVVYHGESCLGELEAIPVKDQSFQFPNNEIRIHHITSLGERCPPLSVLQTISSFSVRCKLESASPNEQPQLINLHASCFYENKTAVVLIGDEEIHLVAMPSKQKKFPCFWCYTAPSGLYAACLGMLNMRCLAIVFDLDETLIVANTMKSFEDRIEALRAWIAREMDPIRGSGMSAEMKRYVEDRALLKQYTENDCVMDNGKMYKVQLEEVPLKSDGSEGVLRPVIRLPDKNIVLTRINPEIRDTSVLVRLRPAWEDLRSYLIAKARKRFEVYVCTMAERDYALEMWRLLDPGANLIGSDQLLNRVVCVNPGAKKSLLNVFQHGNCHPKMAMVIDDRLKVWEDKDQPRVHVVPAFTPYYAPQAETANAVPVLCVARNVACNVRGGFFKEFDENILRRISEHFYEDDVANLPCPPDVSNYLMSEDASFVPNGNTNAPFAEGLNGSEVAQRLNNPSEEKNVPETATHPFDRRPVISQLPATTVQNAYGPGSLRPVVQPDKPSLLGAPYRRDTGFTEADPDAKKRLLTANPNQDGRYRNPGEPPVLSRLPTQQPVPPMQSHGGWLVEEDNSRTHVNSRASGIVQGIDRQRARPNLFSHASDIKNEQSFPVTEVQKKNIPAASPLSEIGKSQNQFSSNNREYPTDVGKVFSLPSSLCIGVLQEIGQRCNSKVEFRSVVGTGEDLQFSFEVLFSGEKIGFGIGKTRKDAQQHAADNALRTLADKYLSYAVRPSRAVDKDFNTLSLGNENGFLWEDELAVENGFPSQSTSEGILEILALHQDSWSESWGEPASLRCRFTTLTNTSKLFLEAADVSLGSTLLQKRSGSPRSSELHQSKRFKEDTMRGPQDVSTSRQPKNGCAAL